MKPDLYQHFLRRLRRHVAHPERFSDKQRAQVVALVCVLVESSDPWTAIEAARTAIAMEATNLRVDHLDRAEILRRKGRQRAADFLKSTPPDSQRPESI